MLAADGYHAFVPSWNDAAFLKISNAVQALTDLTIASDGEVTWEYRTLRYAHAIPERLISTAIELLDPDHIKPSSVRPSEDANLTPLGAARHALARCGLTANIASTIAGHRLTVTNPAQPCRGTIYITDDGELTWNTRAPHHSDGGIPLPDIAAAISRALAQAGHTPPDDAFIRPEFRSD
jgi:hypothetical protein